MPFNHNITDALPKPLFKSIPMDTYDLDDDWQLKIIPFGEHSPMQSHHIGTSIAADQYNKIFYVWHGWAFNIGLSDLSIACNEYISDV